VPATGPLDNLELRASDIDDSLKVYIFNSKSPSGISPSWSGNPESADEGICQGNGAMTVDLAPFVQRGELNGIVLAHADLNCAVSSLGSVDLFTSGVEVSIVGCPGAKDVPPPK
jgi:hypothetical protein